MNVNFTTFNDVEKKLFHRKICGHRWFCLYHTVQLFRMTQLNDMLNLCIVPDVNVAILDEFSYNRRYGSEN